MPDSTRENRPKTDEANPYGSATHTFQDRLDTVQGSYKWFSDHVELRLENLRAELAADDQPSLIHELVAGAIAVVLGSGATAASKALVQRVAGDSGDVPKAFLQSMFSNGYSAGLAAGRSSLAAGDQKGAINSFVDAHKMACFEKYAEDETHYINVSRHEIKTKDDADALATACSKENMRAAAETHHDIVRDAWVSYLAQRKFGAGGAHGPIGPGDVNNGPIGTIMANQQHRDRLNKGLIYPFVPTEAPFFDTPFAHNPGILGIGAALPDISAIAMHGTPRVTVAILNGVNKDIRNQYRGKPLSTMHIPKVIEAKVDGDMPDFNINLDEDSATSEYIDENQSRWLRARALIGSGYEENKDKGYGIVNAGIMALLQDLIVQDVEG